MAEPHQGDPQDPPRSVVNEEVRKSAVRTYMIPLVLFFAGVAALLAYRLVSPPAADPERARPDVEAATGTAGERDVERGPGGGDPRGTPSSTAAEIEERGGRVITELGALVDEDRRGVIGRRVEVRDVAVERVESPTLFWLRDGHARVAVVAPAAPRLQAGQPVRVAGVAEADGDTVRIRASRVDISR